MSPLITFYIENIKYKQYQGIIKLAKDYLPIVFQHSENIIQLLENLSVEDKEKTIYSLKEFIAYANSRDEKITIQDLLQVMILSNSSFDAYLNGLVSSFSVLPSFISRLIY